MRAKAFAMPLNNPAFPPGPYKFYNREFIIISYRTDAEVLRAWLAQPLAWLGMIGSRRKARLMREAFVAEGVATAERMAEVECPVGLEIGAVSPQEIAVSIVARLIERRANSAALSAR